MKKNFQLILISILIYSCAAVVPPTGGKRDKIAPILLNSIPKNQSINYNNTKVELSFDEYIRVENLNQKLLITPAIEGVYTSKILPTGLQLNFEKPFKKDITYSLNFRDAIKDASEGNIAKNVKIVFSTGQKIDSISLAGKVRDIQTGKGLLDVQVGLYTFSDTLNVKKEKPYYFIKTDSSGNYRIENIKAGKYQLVALVDNNSNLLYNSETEKIGFESEPIEIKENLTEKNLVVFMADGIKQKVLKTRNSVNYFQIEYAKGVKEAKVSFEKDSLAYMLSDSRTLKFFNMIQTLDTIKVKIEVRDSLDNVFSHDQKIKFKAPAKKEASKEAFEIKKMMEEGTEISNDFEYELRFSKPVKEINLKKIKILEDTLKKVVLTDKDLKWDNTKTNLKIYKILNSKRETRLIIEKEAFISIEKDTNNLIRADFPIRDQENYGSIAGEIKNNPKNEGLIIQLIDKDTKKTIAEILNKNKYQFDWVKAGTYIVRVIVDKNKNGRWDTGKPEVYTQPERIVYFMDEIILKNNFELIGNDIDL